MDKRLYFSIKITIMIFGIVCLYQVVPQFITSLNALTSMYSFLQNGTYEFKFLLICLGIYVNVIVINCIVNIVFKLQKMLKCEYHISDMIEEQRKELKQKQKR